ncbi:MAG: SGNH/GDSL hydrolase family protein [Azonexus sp.]
MPPIFIGSRPVLKRYIGSTEVTKVYLGLDEIFGAAPPSLPVPSNALACLFGDSRSQGSSGDFPGVNTLNAEGYASWALQAAGYKFSWSANYGVGGSYLIPNDNATYSLRQRLAAVIADPASVVVLLIGVNDGGTALNIWAPEFVYIVTALTGAGKIVMVLDELPYTAVANEAGRLVQIERHQYLASPAVGAISPLVVQVSSFAPMLKAGTTCDFVDGYAPDGLHPKVRGNSVLGGVVGAPMGQLFAAYPSQNNPPTGADDYNAATNPGGCLIPGYMMAGTAGSTAGVTGVVASNHAFSTANAGGVTIDCSMTTDSDGHAQQVIHVHGTPTAGSKTLSYQNLCMTAGNMGYIGAGDYIRSVARVIVDTGAIGFRGFGIGAKLQGNNGVAVNKTTYNFAGTSAEWPSDLPFDEPCASQRNAVYADWSTMTARGITSLLNMSFTGGAPVDFTIRVSRFGVRK